MSEFAERVYYSNNKNKRKQHESDEERMWRLVDTYNKIFNTINKVIDAKSYLQVQNSINAYASEVGKADSSVTHLNTKLKKRIKDVQEQLQADIKKLNKEIEKIKAEKLGESMEQLQELQAQSEQRLLQFLMKLKTTKDGIFINRRNIGNWIVNADRADAIALMRLASMPQFSECFTSHQKDLLVEKSKGQAEIIFEENKNKLLTEKGRELGKLYLRDMNIRNTLKNIANSKSVYFKGQED